MRARRPELARALLGACLAAAAAACGPRAPSATDAARPGQPAASSPAPGAAALSVDGQALDLAQIERVAGWIAELYPQHTLAHDRRRALTALVLPRTAIAHARAAERELALAQARAALERLSAGAPIEPAPRPVEGTWGQLGLELWGPAHALEPGTWSAVEEGIGRFVLLRVSERRPGREAGDLVLALELLEFRYLPESTTAEEVETIIRASKLEIGDPAWREIVPIDWQYRMRGSTP